VAARCQTDAGFVLVGTGSLARELSAHVTAAGLARRVAFLGEVPDAAPYIRQFDVLALPSRHEGLPLVLLEAAARAVPVVAFDVGGVTEVLRRDRPGAKLVAPADPTAFCAAVEAVLRDPERSRLDAIQAAESIRVEFSVSTIASAYCEVYRLSARDPRPHLA
jgi:glycosyltransferase involved in cell wall biosynthesis